MALASELKVEHKSTGGQRMRFQLKAEKGENAKKIQKEKRQEMGSELGC